jgi:hypothetical protein
MRWLLTLSVAVGCCLAGRAEAVPFDCAQASPRTVRSMFENSPYGRGNNPQHRALTTELPIIKPNGDGSCSVTMRVHDWKTGEPAGDLVLKLVVLYFACDRPNQLLASDEPNACPWLNLLDFPKV